MRVLVVTAVAAEADAVCAGLGTDPAPVPVLLPGGYALASHPAADVLAAGVGPAAAASGTATALAAATLARSPATATSPAPARSASPSPPPSPYDLVVSAGIGGGFQPSAPVGSLVVADAIVAADLGAGTPDGFLPVDELGFGRTVHHPPPELSARLAGLLGAAYAPVLTVSTVTGSAARTAELTMRHPRAAAEAMEGFGVAEAAAAYGVPVVEIRAVSNAVGPRDRSAWRIGQALEALRSAFRQLSPVFEEST
ncbi:futalosine hydrolase [Streptomyces sp. NBC_01498]|uniref:futalosine hydrolase n=1 Tax=Streptomyces sp. NBC_01498 TaxID=2975870 RepID=UPI002E7C4F52|nr:futalosine hydrolase [Streptomyces sp. NBC_01498]WTL26224.1 futalosine hydrolase [Streptomyces sp. NBC_01498]